MQYYLFVVDNSRNFYENAVFKSLVAFYTGVLEPLKPGQRTRLHVREKSGYSQNESGRA
jgi:hypothetical protein